mmetsp:Transcript_8564/g.15545  ORF Transcript_8564/g.15545 Transcript_8564/m.15545 type:complete len:879 (-) Transcript_8564:91-2727(-)|eukprot:CAMPEP_0182494064 /NCGR_PEP_ID=MMETSP1321-20130603/2947_1 /TAXON_ID=91990 /ORGANISM="Bolidomonas sp., Strain RCC1657" /LENGTH=878 /DNA_ID=CAMNT_0024697019 /DNA_START=167 /DNA_END=2803 /DNA_ORIENTATION=+
MMFQPLSLLVSLLLITSLSLVTANLEKAKMSLMADVMNSEDLEDLEAQLRQALQALVASKPLGSVAIVGGGLSGLTSSLWLLENGYEVMLIDRSNFLGGNSAKASSGINGAYTSYQSAESVPDSASQFYNDTITSSNRPEDEFTKTLIRRMVDDSKDAVEWILDRAGIPEPILIGQMGGHSSSRTHRPQNGLAGAAFISGLEKAVGAYTKSGQLTIKKGTRVTGLDKTEDGMWKVEMEDDSLASVVVPAVIICTGGFGNDKGGDSLLKEVAPELLSLASTNGEFTTGDGIKMARKLGADTVDMEMVQVHPTGFSDVPKGFEVVDEASRTLILCAEVVRGAGAVLLDREGNRFIDELETRKTVTEAMNEKGEGKYTIVVPPKAAETVTTHMNIYSGKELLVPVEGIKGVAEYIFKRRWDEMGMNTEMNTLLESLKSTFESPTEGVPRRNPTDLPLSGTYYVGLVQPVLHYTMGGLAVNADGHVLNKEGDIIPGLLAAGEVMGGVHGENRLGGSSLLDCVVFGLRAGQSAGSLEKVDKWDGTNRSLGSITTGAGTGASTSGKRKHVQINGKTYDVTDFIKTHPGGAISVEDGEDLTGRFTHAHGNDWSLLDRDSIQEIAESGEVIEREKKFYEDYGSVGGSWREFIGRRAWFVLHSFAAKYPDNPTEADKTAMRNFIAAFGQLYPCKLCRTHLRQQLREPGLGPPAVESREALSVWICELHNIVNVDLGKPQQECKAFAIDMMYLKDCGECEVTKPLEVSAGGDVLEEKEGGGGGGVQYLGPWDEKIYRRGDSLLNTVSTENDAWETNDVADLVEALDVMRKWWRVFDKRDIEGLREELLQGSGERKALSKRITRGLRDVMDGIDGDVKAKILGTGASSP